jgi:hypothetical protein
MRSPCCFLAVCLLGLTCGGEEAPRGEEVPTAAQAAADLKAANEIARATYRAARERVLADVGPVVLWDGDDLVFRYGNYRRVSHPTPAFFHDLKTTGHMVLGLEGLLGDAGDAELGAKQRFELKRYLEAVAKVRRAMPQRALSKRQRQRQEKILEACEGYLTKVLERGKAPVKELRAFLRGVAPLLDENTREAAEAQINGLHREMQRYRSQLSEAEWKRLRVIVQGSQPPRKDHLAVQYFARLLGETGEGARIVYAEMLFDESKAMALLGTKLLDTRVGQDVWEDSSRLHQDLLGPEARLYLDKLFRKK